MTSRPIYILGSILPPVGILIPSTTLPTHDMLRYFRKMLLCTRGYVVVYTLTLCTLATMLLLYKFLHRILNIATSNDLQVACCTSMSSSTPQTAASLEVVPHPMHCLATTTAALLRCQGCSAAC